MKPILFNTEMVKAILDGRKSVTRRVIKLKYGNTHFEIFKNKYGSRLIESQNDVEGETFGKNPDGSTWHKLLAMRETEYDHKPYKVGDVLYVREKFNNTETTTVLYAADKEFVDFGCKEVDGFLFMESEIKWSPSIHMPKKAARIFLKVTGVRVERLRDIIEEQIVKEGLTPYDDRCHDENWKPTFYDPDSGGTPQLKQGYEILWNSTVKKSDSDKYNWDANPWVWVIEFERIEKPNEL